MKNVQRHDIKHHVTHTSPNAIIDDFQAFSRAPERPLLHVCASFPSLRVNEGRWALMVSSFDVGVRPRDERGPRPPFPSCARCPDQFGTAGCRRLLLSRFHSQIEEPAPTRRSLPSSTRIPTGGGAVEFILSWEDFLVQSTKPYNFVLEHDTFRARARVKSPYYAHPRLVSVW